MAYNVILNSLRNTKMHMSCVIFRDTKVIVKLELKEMLQKRITIQIYLFGKTSRMFVL